MLTGYIFTNSAYQKYVWMQHKREREVQARSLKSMRARPRSDVWAGRRDSCSNICQLKKIHFLRFSRRDVLKQTINRTLPCQRNAQTDKNKLAVVNENKFCYNVAHDFMANFTWYNSCVTAGPVFFLLYWIKINNINHSRQKLQDSWMFHHLQSTSLYSCMP